MSKCPRARNKVVASMDSFGKLCVESTAVQREQRRMASKLWQLRGNISGLVALIHIQPHVPTELRVRLLEMINLLELTYRTAIELQFETSRIEIIEANPDIYGTLEEENKLRKANKIRAAFGKRRKSLKDGERA